MQNVAQNAFFAQSPRLFPPNLGAVSDEHGERFCQDISAMETRYHGRFNSNIMGDYCWFLQRDTEATYRRKSKSSTHF